jgi:hypothetical protein
MPSPAKRAFARHIRWVLTMTNCKVEKEKDTAKLLDVMPHTSDTE